MKLQGASYGCTSQRACRIRLCVSGVRVYLFNIATSGSSSAMCTGCSAGEFFFFTYVQSLKMLRFLQRLQICMKKMKPPPPSPSGPGIPTWQGEKLFFKMFTLLSGQNDQCNPLIILIPTCGNLAQTSHPSASMATPPPPGPTPDPPLPSTFAGGTVGSHINLRSLSPHGPTCATNTRRCSRHGRSIYCRELRWYHDMRGRD